MWLIGTIVGSVRYVYIYEDRQVLTAAVTREETPEAMLREQGIEVRPEDEIQFSGFDSAMCEIRITRAFTVHLRADGVIRTFTMTSGTVRDLLEMGNITLRSHDTVSMHLSQELSEGDIVDVKPGGYRRGGRGTAHPLRGRHPLHLAAQGRAAAGALGRYRGRPLDLYPRHLRRRQTGRKQPDGGAGHPAAGHRIPAGGGEGADQRKHQRPARRKRQPDRVSLQNRRGGHRLQRPPRPLDRFRPGSDRRTYRRRSGRVPLRHPDVHQDPLGQLHLREAIAADTGVAMVEGHVDVDLLFETYLEATMFGRRNVEIYVLE